ncbi:hypothetical protein ABW19_dt0201429 [Dactylella cylindrospora]|nr:hypothetical protein ABW19_dt0201429 [Dactylella cylindrospora]
MSTVSLRPILRSPTPSLATSPLRCTRGTSSPSSFTLTKPQHRTATEIRRPKRPYRFEQIVILSDGSSYKQLTTSPQGIFRSNKDVRNHVLWNPSSEKLANVEEDEAGRLRRFREKFGTGFDAAKTPGQEAVMKPPEPPVQPVDSVPEKDKAFKSEEEKKAFWEKMVAEEEALKSQDDNLFGLISGSYVAPKLTDFGRRAKRAKRNAKNQSSGEDGKSK